MPFYVKHHDLLHDLLLISISLCLDCSAKKTVGYPVRQLCMEQLWCLMFKIKQSLTILRDTFYDEEVN